MLEQLFMSASLLKTCYFSYGKEYWSDSEDEAHGVSFVSASLLKTCYFCYGKEHWSDSEDEA